MEIARQVEIARFVMPREGRPLTNLCGTEHECKEFFRPAALGDTAVLRSGFGPQWTWDYRAVPRFVDIGVLIRHNRGLVPEAASDLVERIPDLARSRVEKKRTDKSRQEQTRLSCCWRIGLYREPSSPKTAAAADGTLSVRMYGMGQVAFLFPGQGAQHVGMGKTLCAKFPAAKALFEQASQLLGLDLETLCFQGPQSELDKTDVSQPALYVASLAALEMLRAESPELIEQCHLAAGLSLGEYTALVFAGAMSFEDGLRVVRKRGQAMQAAAEANPSGMVSILMIDRSQVEELVRQAAPAGYLRVANYLCPGNTVVSGDKPACAKVIELAEAAGAKVVPLAVAGAFHTDLMRPADEQLAEALAQVEIRTPRIPVYSNVDAKVHTEPQEIRDVLVRQVLSPVLWEDCMRQLLAANADRFYEIGPGKVLKGLLKRIDRKLECQSVNDTV